MSDKTASKTVHKDKKDNRWRKNKTLNEVKPVGNISENLKSFQEIGAVQKKVLPSNKLQDHPYE